jgi:hypothetical protein
LINLLIKLCNICFSLEPAFWVGKNSLRCWRKLVLEEIAGVKDKDDLEETSDYSSNCTEKVSGPCSNNCDAKMSCDSVTETCEDNNSDDDKLLEQNDQTTARDFKGFSGDKLKCETFNISLNSEGCENTISRVTRSRSKMSSKPVDLLNTHTSKTSPISSHNISTDNAQVPFSGRERCAKSLLHGFRRTPVVSKTKDSVSEGEDMEVEVSSTVPSDHEELQNVNSVHLVVCDDSVVTSSDEVLTSRRRGCKMELSEITKEENSIPKSVWQNAPMLKEHIENSSTNVSTKNVAQTCTENSVKPLEPKSSYIRIKTPGFGDDIIQSVEDGVMCQLLGQKSNKRPAGVALESDVVRENREEFEEKTISDVSFSGDVTVSNADDETFHNGEQEGDEESFNDDINCTHGELSCKLFIIIIIIISCHRFFFFPGASPH